MILFKRRSALLLARADYVVVLYPEKCGFDGFGLREEQQQLYLVIYLFSRSYGKREACCGLVQISGERDLCYPESEYFRESMRDLEQETRCRKSVEARGGERDGARPSTRF